MGLNTQEAVMWTLASTPSTEKGGEIHQYVHEINDPSSLPSEAEVRLERNWPERCYLPKHSHRTHYRLMNQESSQGLPGA